MSVRVHCEACGDDFEPTQNMAVLALPTVKRSPWPMLGTKEVTHESHHLCPPCGKALLAFARGVKRSLRDEVSR